MKKQALIITIIIIALCLLGFVFIRNLIDFPVYYSAGQSLLNGRTDLYSPDFAEGPVMDYRYPPFFLVALAPLWLLPYPVAAFVWHLISVFLIAGCVYIVNRQSRIKRAATAARLAIFFVACPYFIMILHYGNAHLLAIFFLFASFYFIGRQNDFKAALAIALAITIKLTPILILPYFALKKKWRFLSFAALLLVILNLAPSAYFGMTNNARLLKTWYERVIADQEFHEINGPINLSLKGQMRRLFSEVDYSERVDGDTRYPSINIASFAPEAIQRIWKALAGMIFFATLAFIWARRGGGKKRSSNGRAQCDHHQGDCDNAMMLELSLMICAMLMVEPLTSKIYFIALLWPAAALAAFAFNGSAPPRRRVKRALIFAAAISSVLPLLPGRWVQRWLLVLGPDFYLNCLLMACVIYALVALGRESQSLSGEPQTQALSTAKTS